MLCLSDKAYYKTDRFHAQLTDFTKIRVQTVPYNGYKSFLYLYIANLCLFKSQHLYKTNSSKTALFLYNLTSACP